MAKLLRKNYLFGIPNGFEMLSEEEVPQAEASVFDELLNKQIARMDMDGRTVLAEEYYELVAAICDCDACLTVNYQKRQDRAEDTVFWETGASFLRADVVDDCFVFVAEDAAGIKSYFSTVVMGSRDEVERKSVTIPHITLAKAKRALADKRDDDAKRTLLQNGTGSLADAILAGLKEEANYLGLLLMVNKPIEKPLRQAAFLCAGGILLELSETVMNYRNSTVFSVCSKADAANQIQTFYDQFAAPSKETPL